MENSNVNLLIAAFAALIIGASMIAVIASEEQKLVSMTHTTNEVVSYTPCMTEGADPTLNGTNGGTCVFTLVNAPTDWQLIDTTPCPLTNVVVKNSTKDILVLDTDYNLFAANGTVGYLNTSSLYEGLGTAQSNTSYVDYEYCADSYINASWTRSVMNIVVGFFAFALIAIALMLFYGVAKNEGLLNI